MLTICYLASFVMFSSRMPSQIARTPIIAKLVRCHAEKIASHLPHTLSRRKKLQLIPARPL